MQRMHAHAGSNTDAGLHCRDVLLNLATAGEEHSGCGPHRVKELQSSAAEGAGAEVLRALSELVHTHEVLRLCGSKGRGEAVQLLHLEALVGMPRQARQRVVPIKAAIEERLVLQLTRAYGQGKSGSS